MLKSITKKYHQPFWVLLLTSLVVACGREDSDSGAGSGGPGMLPTVEVAPVEKRDLTREVRLVGSLAAYESVEVRPEISGLVRQISFSEGSEVEEGEVLVVLDQRNLRAQLGEAEALLLLADQELERNRSLWEDRSVARRELDLAQAERDRASARVDQLEVMLDQTEIRAPFAGTVGSRSISLGDLVTPQTIVTRVDDLSALRIEFQVPERFIEAVQVGSRVDILQVGVTALTEGKSAAEVYFIDRQIGRSTRASQIKALYPDPPAVLRPGMFVNLSLVLEVVADALVVPEGAIAQEARGNFVFLVEENEEGQSVIRRLPVELGIRERGYVQILGANGLEEGAKVVAAGAGILQLADDLPVNTRPARELANRDI